MAGNWVTPSKRKLEGLSITAALLAVILGLGQISLSAKPNATDASGVEGRVDAMLSRTTLEDKLNLLGGTDGFYTQAVPDINLPRLRMADGPLGVRNFGPATAMAGGINLAATWDTELARRVGEQLGQDARAKGVNFLLGPGVNIYRAPCHE